MFSTPPKKYLTFWPFSKRQILHCTQMKEFADDISKFDENG